MGRDRADAATGVRGDRLAVGLATIVVAIARAINGADRVALWGVLVVSVLLAMLASAHRAMMRDLDRLQPRVQVGGPPRRAVLLCNPWSGGGKVEQFGLVDLAAELGVETVLLDRGLDLEQLARDAVARGADCLGMAGGDGSQALVASIAIEHGLPFVCVSAGTRNHFALDLGLNRDDPRESMLAFRDAVERTVDYATVNGRLFVNNVSLGVYAQIVQEEAYRDAKVETTKVLLPEMLGRQAAPFDLQFTTPSGAEVDGAILIMVSNNPYVIGASPDNAQRRHLDSGKLGVFGVTTSTGAAAAVLFAATAPAAAPPQPVLDGVHDDVLRGAIALGSCLRGCGRRSLGHADTAPVRDPPTRAEVARAGGKRRDRRATSRPRCRICRPGDPGSGLRTATGELRVPKTHPDRVNRGGFNSKWLLRIGVERMFAGSSDSGPSALKGGSSSDSNVDIALGSDR